MKFLMFLAAEKKKKLKNINKKKLNKKKHFDSRISYCSPIVNINSIKLIFLDLPSYNKTYCNKKLPDNQNKCCHFCHGGETHFLMFAQTMM